MKEQERPSPALEASTDPVCSPIVNDRADRQALDLLVQRKYSELKNLAKKIRWRDPKASLTATALLNEAYVRLSQNRAEIAGKEHSEVLAIFANVMWEILADTARKKLAVKRGGSNQTLSLSTELDRLDDITALSREDILTLKFAREELRTRNPRAAHVLDCRFSLGLTVDEAAAALKLSKTMVERESRAAKAFLLARLGAPR